MAGAATVRWRKRDRGWRKLKAEIAKAAVPRNVAIGLQGSLGSAQHRGAGESGRPKTVAEIGATHEFGAQFTMPSGRVVVIPQRSFLRATIDANQAKYRRLLKGVGLAVVDGRTNVETGLGAVGELVVGDVKQRIADGIPPPNAPSTIRRKGSSTPLIHHGQTRNSITKELRK